MNIQGTFEVTMQAEPPYDETDGVTLARASFDKRFVGALEAKSRVEMLGVRTPIASSAGYVALERVTGTLLGKQGTFVLMHSGVMNGSTNHLSVTVVPDSGTAELRGLSGQMTISIVGGQHYYDFSFELGA